MFVHTVFFWIKGGGADTSHKRLMDDCLTLLGKVPGVLHIWAGAPAKTPRNVVDNSYDVGMTVIFSDRTSHNLYQEHPLHLEFIERNKPHWERVQIYDYVQSER